MAHLNIGDPAPDFALADQEGNTVNLADFKGKKLLLYFYPRANTPGCTKQACQIRVSRTELADVGVAAVGISPDKPGAQKKFDEKQEFIDFVTPWLIKHYPHCSGLTVLEKLSHLFPGAAP